MKSKSQITKELDNYIISHTTGTFTSHDVHGCWGVALYGRWIYEILATGRYTNVHFWKKGPFGNEYIIF